MIELFIPLFALAFAQHKNPAAAAAKAKTQARTNGHTQNAGTPRTARPETKPTEQPEPHEQAAIEAAVQQAIRDEQASQDELPAPERKATPAANVPARSTATTQKSSSRAAPPKSKTKTVITQPMKPSTPKTRAAAQQKPSAKPVSKPLRAAPTTKPRTYKKHPAALVAAARDAVAAVNGYVRRNNRAPTIALAEVRNFQAKDGVLQRDGEYGPNSRKAAAYYLDKPTAQMPPVAKRFQAYKVTWQPHD